MDEEELAQAVSDIVSNSERIASSLEELVALLKDQLSGVGP